MTLNNTTIALDILVLLGILVSVEWIAHVLTDTRNMFVPAVPTLGIDVVLRMAFLRGGRDAPGRPLLQTDPYLNSCRQGFANSVGQTSGAAWLPQSGFRERIGISRLTGSLVSVVSREDRDLNEG
jgi:hypothetical protein